MEPIQIPSVAEHLRVWSGEIEQSLTTLLTENGELLDDRRDNWGDVVFITVHPYRWPELSTDAKRQQSRLLDEYRRYTDVLKVLLQGQPERSIERIRDDIDVVVGIIERHHSGLPTASKNLEKATAALEGHLAQVQDLYSATATTILVPDTNALYWNPALEQWRSPDNKPFNVVLTPAVVAEIDAHKSDHRNGSRRKKAERIVRKISEYRRRGRLIDGVTLVRDVSTISAVAAEPRMADALPWLDPSTPDDRFLASAMEVMRTNTRAPLVVITRDVNLQNKLEFARLPFLDPSAFIPEAPETE